MRSLRNRLTTNRAAVGVYWGLVGWFLLTGCAQRATDKQKLVMACAYGDDQKSTFLGDWKTHAVPLAFAAGNFSADEKKAMLAAVDTWNKFYGSVAGFPVFDANGGQEVATSSPPSNVCASHPILQNGKFVDSVVLYKLRSGWTHGSAAIGVTTTCPDQRGTFYNAQIELNFQDYFAAGKWFPDIQTILLHELGHLGGLDHSCEGGGKSARGTAVPDCGSPTLAVEYYNAAMYPVMQFTNKIQVPRQTLQANDQGRANCLQWQ